MGVLETILWFIIICGGVVYLSACLFAFSGHLRSHEKVGGYFPSVSLIIAARNEVENIGFLLDDLMKQDYPAEKLEIVVVDDCSDDNTAGIVR